MEQFVSNVKYFTECLLQKQMTNCDDVIEELFSKACGLENFPQIPDPMLEECAIQLWNWAVTKNTGSSLTNMQKAKVRHVACSLLYCCEGETPTEGRIRKQILMASKAGRTWLDCKNPPNADIFLNLAVKSLETLYSKLTSRADRSSDTTLSKEDVEKDLLRILSFQAESALSQGNNTEALAFIQRCKDMLLRLPKDTAYLSLMCYNFGVDTYNMRKFEDSTIWLSQSYNIAKMNVKYAPESQVQARILRLLATVYVEWDCQRFQEKALNAVSLANKECMSTSGLYLKIRILLRCGASDDHIRAGLSEILEVEAALDECLSTVNLLVSEDRELLAFEFLKRVCQHFEASPDLGSALVLHAELLLQRGKELLGKQKIEDIITGHYTGKQLSPQALTCLHLMLWDKACKYFEARNYSEALQWYNYSLSFFQAGQLDPNLAKLQRNRASCFLQLKQLEKAKDAVKEAERCDPDSIFTQFSVYKVAVLENNAEKAAEALKAMGLLSKAPVSREDRLLVPETAASHLLKLAAQIALENEQQEAAMKALEILCENCDDAGLLLSALRCLVRLLLSTIEQRTEGMSAGSLDVLLPYLKMALHNISHQSSLAAEQRTEYADWFRKIAWNSALYCESRPDRMRDFFVLSYQLSHLCPPDRGLLMGQKTCLLMAAAASLELCRKSLLSDQTEELTRVLEQIQTCREVWKTLKASGNFSTDPTDTLLLLYEFEACAKLNNPKVETVLESVLELQNVEAKVLETIAALAMEPPAHFPLLCRKALRVALALHRNPPQVDLSRCSKCIHSLINLSLPSGVSEAEARVLQEAWGYYEEALSIIAASPDDFPQMETLWLLTRAWNTGILLYSLARYVEAEKWCGLAMSFVRHLGSLQESYETQMSTLYAKILDRLEKARIKHGPRAMEE
uniref:Protein ZIP4 homolog n=1 Tax=Takifugu rubripes TaxID=31033 RepID=H2TKU1_TAKRU